VFFSFYFGFLYIMEHTAIFKYVRTQVCLERLRTWLPGECHPEYGHQPCAVIRGEWSRSSASGAADSPLAVPAPAPPSGSSTSSAERLCECPRRCGSASGAPSCPCGSASSSVRGSSQLKRSRRKCSRGRVCNN
jgi:hypothetical protein